MDIQVLVKFSQKLISLENRIDKRQYDYRTWYSLWFDMVGTLYSLYKVRPLLREMPRKFPEMIDHAKKVLLLIETNKEIEEREHNAWFDGYFLNNAEFRISLALHCLLKACYPCNRRHQKDGVGVPGLINKICLNRKINNLPHKRECFGSDADDNKCNEIPITLNEECTKILTDFFDYHDERKSNRDLRPVETGHYLLEVHFRVNALKHTPDPEEDLMPPYRRIEEAWEGLLGIHNLYTYISKQRGALKAL